MPVRSTSFARSKVGFVVDGDGTGGAVKITPSSNLTVAYAAGSFWLGGKYTTILTGTVTHSAAHATLGRIDVIQVNDSGTVSIVAGTPAASPTPPVTFDDVILLAQVTVAAGATVINAADIQDLRDIAIFSTVRAPPVGAIMPWAKTLTGVPALPAGWVQCDGQTLSEALSPMNGQVIPDLNGGNRFLRGNSTSGATGGAATVAHTHTYSGTTSTYTPVGTSAGSGVTTVTVGHNHTFSGTTSAASDENNLPPYYNVVWIMRVY